MSTWFSGTMWLVAALCAALIAQGERRGGGAWTLHWVTFAALLGLMSIDEAASLHELLSKPIRGWLDIGGLFYYAWILPAMLVLVILALLSRRFLAAQPNHLRRRLLLGFGLLVSGAIGVEMFAGVVDEAQGVQHFGYALLVLAEETLEMAGSVTILHALLAHACEIARPSH